MYSCFAARPLAASIIKDGSFAPAFHKIRLLTVCLRNVNKCLHTRRGCCIISLTAHPGVAQLVARLLWEQDAAGSNPVTRTKTPLKSTISEGFSYSLSIAAQDLRTTLLALIDIYHTP